MPTTVLDRTRPRPVPQIDEGPLAFDIISPRGDLLASLASQAALAIALSCPAFGVPAVRLQAGCTISVRPRRKRSYHPSPPLKKAAEDLHALVRSRKVRT
jgi:hypothetical protein